MVTIRYKKTKSEKYSIYLDIYTRDANGKARRGYEFLKIHVTQDYNKVKRIREEDKEFMELAKAIKAKREIEIINSEHGFIGKKQRKDHSLTEYYKNICEKSRDYHNTCIFNHINTFADQKELFFSDITPEWLEEFKDYLMLRISQNTVHSYLCGFKTKLNRAVKKELIQKNPFDDFEIPREQEIERTTLELSELKQLQNTPTRFNIQIRQAFLFSCFTGLRLSDVRKLQHTEVQPYTELQDGQEVTLYKLVFTPQKTRNRSGKLIYLPLTEQAKQIYDEVERNPASELVFWKLPSKSMMGKHIQVWGLQAGIKKHVHFHCARHTFATIGLTYGIDLYTMKEYLGHSNIEMTQIYAKIVDEKKRAEIKKFPTLS